MSGSEPFTPSATVVGELILAPGLSDGSEWPTSRHVAARPVSLTMLKVRVVVPTPTRLISADTVLPSQSNAERCPVAEATRLFAECSDGPSSVAAPRIARRGFNDHGAVAAR